MKKRKVKFKEYNSIHESHKINGDIRDRYRKFLYSGLENVECFAEEKVHGGNYNVFYDGNEFDYALRRGFISKYENQYHQHMKSKGFEEFKPFSFFGDVYKEITPKEQIKALYNGLAELRGSKPKYIRLIGELAGGDTEPNIVFDELIERDVYVARDGYDLGLQRNIKYSKRQFLYFFDIEIDGKIIDPVDARTLMETFNIPCPRIVRTGKLKELVDFYSDVGNLNFMNLTGQDYAEGVVIKPKRNQTLKGGERVIVKIISPKYQESKNIPVKKRNKVSIDTEIKMIFASHVTENRINKVLVNIGIDSPSKNQYGVIINAVKDDVVKEYKSILEEGEKDEYSTLTKREQKAIKSFIGSKVALILNGQIT